MASFATTAQYIARYGAVADTAMLQECLDDATAAICAALDEAKVPHDDPSEEFADRLMRVCRSMANRCMPSQGFPDIPQGVTQASTTAGPYTQSLTFPASYGTPKPLPSELKMLGIGGGRVGWAPMGGHDD